MLDATLEDGREFLCADRFTLADICISYALLLGTTLGLDERYNPQTTAYLERMMRRPAFIAARKEESESLASRSYAADPSLRLDAASGPSL